MKRASRLQIENVLRAYLLMLFALLALWAVASLLLFGDILIGRPLIIANLIFGLPLAWFYYRSRYHETLEWDDDGFHLRRGARTMTGRWADFCAVALHHAGRGVFAVRLYRDEGLRTSLEFPVARMGLKPARFRDEVTVYVLAARSQAAADGAPSDD